jgi:serine/threonine-protein kinase
MTETSNDRLPEDPAGSLWRLWCQGQRPDVRRYLADAGALSPAQVAAVLGADRRARWQRGERVPVEEYLRQFPAVGADPESALELIYGEFFLREELGEQPALAEYLERFPQYAARLREQVALHEALGPDPVSTQPAAGPGGPPLAPFPQVSPGSTIAGYEILGELGRGGLGVVYRARQVKLNRLVALKMIRRREGLAAEQLARFRTEAEAIARLQHPNIVQIFDTGEHQGQPFLALELIEGGTLAQQVNAPPLPARRSAELVRTLAGAVAYAHGRGVLHRDLKPANILLTADGVPKIADFGLAKCLDDDPGHTLDGQLVGTPCYMAPEQASGQAELVGPHTDVFGLGAILYQLLTGRPLYQATDQLGMLEQARQGQVVPPRRLNRRVPRALERICSRALAADPRQRYATAGELEQDLGRYLHRRWLAVAGCGVTGLLLLAVASWSVGRSGRPQAPPDSPPPVEARRPDAPPPRRGDAEPPPMVRPAEALAGDLSVQVWSPTEEGPKHGLRVDEPGALPVANGERVKLHAGLNQPAYLYLLWITSQGEVKPLYPWDPPKRGFAGTLPPPRLESEMDSPDKLAQGWRVKGPGGLETALLLARLTPLGAEVNLEKEMGRLPATRLRNHREVVWLELVPGQALARRSEVLHRDLDLDQAEDIDDPVLKLMERLRAHFDLIKAVRFAHQGD